MKSFRLVSVFSAFIVLCSGVALAQQGSDVVNAQIKPGWKTSAGTHMSALKLRLAPDWITYWRHPGESGIVPRLDWSGSRNIAQARIVWPEPRLHIKAGFASVGYADQVTLPIEITPVEAGQPVELAATLSLGVCNDICIPVDLPFNLSLSGAGLHDAAIATALEKRPRSARSAGLRDVSCTIAPHKRGVQLSAALSMPPSGAREFVVIEAPGLAARVLPTERQGDKLIGHSLIRSSGDMPAIDRSAVRLSVVSERGTVVHQGCALGN